MTKDAAWNPLARLTAAQRDKLAAFRERLLYFNRRLNLISKDTEATFDERHLLHTLALTYKTFPAGSAVVDWGTGGGLPAIPLAICFPKVTVHAVDAVGKKIQAVRAMGRKLGLDNLHPWQGRAEDWPGTAIFSVSRATAPLLDLWQWHRNARAPLANTPEDAWRPGLVCLKGGDLSEEIAAIKDAYPDVSIEKTSLEALLGRSYFKDKYIVEVYA